MSLSLNSDGFVQKKLNELEVFELKIVVIGNISILPLVNISNSKKLSISLCYAFFLTFYIEPLVTDTIFRN